jgi:hypothetical protein
MSGLHSLNFGREVASDLRPPKSGIFLCKWHKKVAAIMKTIVVTGRRGCTGGRIIRQNDLVRLTSHPARPQGSA